LPVAVVCRLMRLQAVNSLVTFFEEKPDSEVYFAILEVDGNAKVCCNNLPHKWLH
jgi:hypothetical protein